MHERLLISTHREDPTKDAISWIRCTVDSAIVTFIQIISVILVHLADNTDCTEIPLKFWFKIFAAFHGLDIVNQYVGKSVRFKGIRSSLMYLSYALIHFAGYLMWAALGIVWYLSSDGNDTCKKYTAFKIGHALMRIYVIILLFLFSLMTLCCMYSILSRCFDRKI